MAPRGLWIFRHPIVALMVGLGVMALAFYVLIALVIIGAVALLIWAGRRLARR